MGNTILIAEDNEPQRKSLAAYFVSFGFVVFTAATVRESVKLASLHLPDCFLLDYHLADGTAQEVCSFIRNCERLKDAPIVILSGDPDQSATSYEDCQADSFVIKGCGYRTALVAVRRLLRRTAGAGGLASPTDLAVDRKALRVLRKGEPFVELPPEQFRLFSMLFERRPAFIPESDVIEQVFNCSPREKCEALASLVYRLRKALGPRYGRRVVKKKGRGWAYIQPRLRFDPVM